MDSKGSILCKRETERDFIDTGKLQDTDLEKHSDMTIAKECWQWSEAGRGKGHIYSRAWPCAHVNFCPLIGISDFWASKTLREYISIPEAIKCVVACYNSHRKQCNCYWVQPSTAWGRTGQSIQRWVVGARNSNFTWKACRPRRWWTNVPNNHYTWVEFRLPLC